MLTATDRSTASQTRPSSTLGDVLVHLERDPLLDAARRKTYAGAIRTLTDILHRPAESLPAAMPEIERLLATIPRSSHGRSAKTIANLRSTLKSALLFSTPGGRNPPRGTPLRPEWTDLKCRLTTQRLRNGLSRMIRLASFQGVVPEAMNDTVFQSMVDTVRSRNWGRDVLRFERDVPQLWNEAVGQVPGWPAARLTERAAVARQSHLPLAAFPASFQMDVNNYLEWAAGRDPLAADAPKQALKASTLKLRRSQLRIAASTLAEAKGDALWLKNLADLVEPENAKTILLRYLKADRSASNAFVIGLCMTLRAAAKDWVRAPQEQLAELARIQRRIGSVPAGLTKKNRDTLRQFEDPRLLGQLLALPSRLRKDAKSRARSPGRRLEMLRTALAIDILLAAPMRAHNLATLQLDRQLQWPTGRGGTLYVTLNGDETKNEQPLEYPLPDSLRDLVHEYLDQDRPRFPAEVSPWLLVDIRGKPVSVDTLRDGISKAIKRELGVAMTPHQFRHLAAKLILDAHPEALGLVRNLLGHKNIKTTHNFYAGMRTAEAGRFYNRMLAAHRVTERAGV